MTGLWHAPSPGGRPGRSFATSVAFPGATRLLLQQELRSEEETAMTEHTVAVRPFAVTVEATTELAAPAAKAWKVLADTAAYPEWNPFVNSFDGPLAVGQ